MKNKTTLQQRCQEFTIVQSFKQKIEGMPECNFYGSFSMHIFSVSGSQKKHTLHKLHQICHISKKGVT